MSLIVKIKYGREKIANFYKINFSKTAKLILLSYVKSVLHKK